MSRAFSLLTLLRRRTVAAASVRKDQAGRALAESEKRATEKRTFPQKPPEPKPIVKTRVFEKAPGLRRSWM